MPLGDRSSDSFFKMTGISKDFPQKLYESKPALSKLSLQAKLGELVWIQGPNGAGKSTALRIAARVLDPNKGQVTYNFDSSEAGSIFWYTASCFSRIGLTSIQLSSYVLKFASQNDEKSEGAQKQFDKHFEEHFEEHFKEVFQKRCNQAGLNNSDLKKSFAALSTGQQQIVKLALFTSIPSQLLLFDEPFNGLSPEACKIGRKWIKEELEGCKKTFIIISHEQTIAEDAHRVYTILEGAIVSEEEIFPSPSLEEISEAAPTSKYFILNCILGMLDKNLLTSRRYLGWTLSALVPFIVASSIILFVAKAYGSGDQLKVVFFGIIVWNFLGSLLIGLTANLEKERFDGTLEFLMSQQKARPALLISQALWSLINSALQGCISYIILMMFYDGSIDILNLRGFIGVLLVSSLLFIAIGILLGSLTLLSRFGSRTASSISALLLLTSGAYYPPDVLPDFFKNFAELNPMTLCFRASRVALGVEEGELLNLLGTVGIISIGVLLFSFKAFSFSLKIARKRGTLTQ